MEEVKEILIIGAGPAGLTAAIYAARGGSKPFVIGGVQPGQLMTSYEVENYPGFPEKLGGPQLIDNMVKQAEKFGAKIIQRDVTAVDFSSRPFKVEAGDAVYRARAVIIATGASPRWIGLESEQRLIGRGVSSCATCDGFFFRDRDVVVVGGGDAAMEETLFLARITRSVTVIHRRDKLRAERILQERAFENQKIRFQWNSVVEEILGENLVEGVRIKNVKTGEISELECQGVFVAIGYKPNTEIFRGKVEMDEKGYINVKDTTGTSVEGVFVAGDAYDYVYRQAVTAAASGCRAAIDVVKYLESIETP
ncbi:MAG: thioredoxin-disulfide reductase [Nitrososphaeria archaeon]|nr:thioredoxin-disulfide reductase [Nitrososphaeria archaeon]NIQ33791.1 thioredoxin-disulfide reductase [Nitrososphaeria archaeon]